MSLFALLTIYHEENNRIVFHAMPVMLVTLLVLAIAYRFYSGFLAAKVAAFDDNRVTPAVRHDDGQNYHPTNKWVLFGHHFAAISGAGPLIGPVLAIQYGYLPGLIWLLVGVCLAGAVQDMLILTVSVRSDGKSLAEIARRELGRPASIVASLAILFIVIIALAGLGLVVVKALGGEVAAQPVGMVVTLPENVTLATKPTEGGSLAEFPVNCRVRYRPGDATITRPESFVIRSTEPLAVNPTTREVTFPAGCVQVIPGSSWGTFTIAMTIPIALFIGFWMQKIRPGRVVEASLMGGAMVLMAVVAGNWIPGSSLEPFFSLTKGQTVLALTIYGFIAAVLPVWMLLGPRDYLSSFLKIGTIGMLVVGVCVANPPMQAPEFNETFVNGGPTFAGNIFPFVFICVMCGAVSGFHSLVSSGTTPKMVSRESHIRTIGYGAMLMECLVAVTALIAASCLPPDLYYDINVAVDKTPQFAARVQEINAKYGVPKEAHDPLHQIGTDKLEHMDLGKIEEKVGGESLRGRTGGAVTLAVGMSVIFEQAFLTFGVSGNALLKYWYHFAIMFEALFILTTIDAGTRIGRFLLQETLGRVYAPFARPDWLPGAIIAAALITGGWGWLIYDGSIDTIWSMFGVSNQLLAVMALALITTYLINTGKARYAPLTILPMLWVVTTTLTAGTQLILYRFPDDIAQGKVFKGRLNIALTSFVMISTMTVVLWSVTRWLGVLFGFVPVRKES
ncbi:MAG: carbon starvation CstA family protein [Fimbriiglobus sp.]